MAEHIHGLGDKLKAMQKIRKRADKSQQWVADRLGITQSMVARYEAGDWKNSEHMATLINLDRLLDELQLEAAMHEAEDGN